MDAGQPSVVGGACTGPSDCSSLGAGGTCKTNTTLGNGTYTGGYCTLQPCSNTTMCPAADSLCTNIPGSLGESQPMCLKKCTVGGSDCRTPGYTCYSLQSGTGGVCFIDQAHLPTYVDAGRPSDKVGGPCTSDTACQSPPDPPFQDLGFCFPESLPDGGPTGFTGGYCFTDCTDFGDAICGANAVCLGIGNNTDWCFSKCTTPGAGQGSCRNGYVCQGTRYTDGGPGPDSYCDTSCFAPGNGCNATAYCDAGYCLPK
jgi:hypothetical protein